MTMTLSPPRYRIGLLIDSLIGGGAERIVLNFAQAFMQRGHDVHVIILKNEIEHVIPEGVSVHALSQDGQLAAGRTMNKLRLACALRQRVKQIESDSIPFAFFLSNAEDMDKISWLARLPNVYIRYRNSMVQYLEHKIGNKTGFKRWSRRVRWTRKLRSVYSGRHIVTVSEALRSELVQQVGIRPRSIATIYNPFHFEQLRSLAQQPADLPSAPYIIYVAKFENRKRQDVLLRAYASSAARNTHQLILIGGTYTDSDRAWLQSMQTLIAELGIQDRVVMPGFQRNPYPWIAGADLFAMSSDGEGLPTVLVESLILGTPVVSTDCPTGPSEVLTDDLAQFLSPTSDWRHLGQNIDKALASYPSIDEKRLARFRADHAVECYLEHCTQR